MLCVLYLPGMQVTNGFHYRVLVLKRTDSGQNKMLNDVSKSQKVIFAKEFTHVHFQSQKNQIFPKGLSSLFWSVPLRKYGDVICPLQKRSFTVTLHKKKCIYHPCSDDVALSLSLQKIFLGICTVKKLRN